MGCRRRKLLGILSVEVVLFAVASLAHRVYLIRAYEHAKAANAEAVIAAVLAVGLVLCLTRPVAARAAALWAEGFALVGVVVGLVMIAIGVGSRTGRDFALHALVLVTLVFSRLLTAGRLVAAQRH